VLDIQSVGDFSIPLDKLALHQEDLRDGILLAAPKEMNSVILSNGMGEILEMDDYSDNFKDSFISYAQTLLDLGFVCKWSVGCQEGNYQQDINVFFTSDGAERSMSQLPQVTMDLLVATYEEAGLDAEAEIINIDSTELGMENWGIYLTTGSGLGKGYLHQVCVRERNLLSIITIASSLFSSPPYSGKIVDDALLLSQKAIERIQSQLGSMDLLIPMPKDRRFLDLLRLVPSDVINRNDEYIIMNDYATIRDLFDISIPRTLTEEDIEEYMISMYGISIDYHIGMATGSFISGHDMFAVTTPIRLENVGFNLFNVDADIHTSYHSVYTDNYTQFYTALIGRFDPIATHEALNNQVKWPEEIRDKLNSEDYQDITIYSWIDGYIKRENIGLMPPNLDTNGRAFPLAVTKDNVYYSESVDSIKLMIDSSMNLTDSLADIQEYKLAAEGLSELGAYSGIIGNEVIPNSIGFQRDESSAPLLRLYIAYGTGVGRDFLGPYMALVLVHDDSEKALENVEILIDRIHETKWIRPVDWEDSWRLYVDYIQIRAEDNVILAKLYGDRGMYIWERWLLECYPLLLHE